MSNTKKVVIVRRSTVKSRKPRFPFPVEVPVNVKVQGQRAMLKGVTLVPVEKGKIKVLTGTRGRPSFLTTEQIVKVRAL